jgi:uncharacterized integral membrane protein
LNRQVAKNAETKVKLDNSVSNEFAVFMNSKQLSNVLIKILGLSIGIHAFPVSILAAISAFEALIHAMQNVHPSGIQFAFWTYSLTSLIQAVIEFAAGIFLIVRSRWVTDILFKNEAE